MSDKTLLEYETQWAKQICSSCFLGEITLDRETVDRLCRELGRNALRHSAVLTVLAVNCAYYYLDRDGFWPHFCAKLGLTYDATTTDSLGSCIERRLNSIYPDRRRRTGSYRYVGAILEHCGVTRKQLPGFSDFLKTLHDRYGWDGILGLDYTRYRAQIPTTGSRYLHEFLSDQVGWEFVRDVARNLSQRDRRILETSQLESLAGYHPSFWGEVSALLQLPPPPPTSRRLPAPAVALDPISRSIQIRLDSSGSSRTAYKLDGCVMNSATYTLRKESDFRASYSFEVLIEDSWVPVTVQGWLPKEVSYAFFHPSKGYVGDATRLKPGVYLLAAARGINVPDELIVANHGTLSLFCGFFRILQIRLTETSDLTAFGVHSHLPTTPYLSFPDTCGRLQSSTDRRVVFTDELPSIRINNLEANGSGRYVLLAEVDGRQKRIDEVFLRDSVVDLQDIGFRFPCQGALWIEATGRSLAHAGEQIVDRLDFVAIKSCWLDGPSHLVSASEEVELSIKGPGSYWIHLEEGKKANEEGTRWVVGPHVRLVEGILWADKIPVRIAHRIFRASMYTDNGGDTIFSDDLDAGLLVHAEGVPKTALELYLASPEKSRKLGSPGEFDTAGHLDFNSFSFRDAISAGHVTAGRFEFGRPGGTASTAMFFLNLQTACEGISHVKDAEPGWFGFLSQGLKNFFKFLYGLAIEEDLNAGIKIDGLPPRLLKLGSSFIACAEALDGRDLPPTDFEALDHPCHDILTWYREASSAIGTGDESRARTLVEGYPGVEEVPLERWKRKVEGILKKIKSEALHLLELVDEWANEVRGPARTTYAGHIANLHHGMDIIECWRLYYCHGKPDLAFHRASRSLEHVDGIVNDLARLLAMLCLVKLGENSEARIYLGGQCNPLFLRLGEALAGKGTTLDREVLGHFPIRDEDHSLFRGNG